MTKKRNKIEKELERLLLQKYGENNYKLGPNQEVKALTKLEGDEKEKWHFLGFYDKQLEILQAWERRKIKKEKNNETI